MRITADVDRCVGSGQCVLIDPTVFDQDEYDGTVVLLSEEVEGEAEEHAREAAHNCPGQVFTLR